MWQVNARITETGWYAEIAIPLRTLRFHEVEVTGLDEKGQSQTWRVKGWPARILQHEVDHLAGTLYIDRMLTRSFGTMAQVKARFAGKAIADIKLELGVVK